MNKALLFPILIIFLLSSCSSRQGIDNSDQVVNSTIQRTTLLKSITDWNISGKIAFISPTERQSANINWQVQKNQQSLNMTTYLGINVLSINEHDNLAVVEVDGKTYRSDDLELLIFQLTRLRLPTEALHFWVKGLPYLSDDRIRYNSAGWPEKLTSQYDNVLWQISYAQYHSVSGIPLAKKLTITQDKLTIKLVINRWVI